MDYSKYMPKDSANQGSADQKGSKTDSTANIELIATDSKDSKQTGSFQQYMDYQKYMPQGGQTGGFQQYIPGGATHADDTQVPHVGNWSNHDEVRDKFMDFFAKGQIPHVKNWSNPGEVKA